VTHVTIVTRARLAQCDLCLSSLSLPRAAFSPFPPPFISYSNDASSPVLTRPLPPPPTLPNPSPGGLRAGRRGRVRHLPAAPNRPSRLRWRCTGVRRMDPARARRASPNHEILVACLRRCTAPCRCLHGRASTPCMPRARGTRACVHECVQRAAPAHPPSPASLHAVGKVSHHRLVRPDREWPASGAGCLGAFPCLPQPRLP
jgi:hypothetical protein